MIILTGAPGSGKTTLINELSKLGHTTVPEAATDIIIKRQACGIKEPWQNPGFISDIFQLQRQRIIVHQHQRNVFFDRSPICTYALCKYLKKKAPTELLSYIKTMPATKVFFIESLDSIENNAIRTITLDEAKSFGEMHLNAYKTFNYSITYIKPDSVKNRLNRVLGQV